MNNTKRHLNSTKLVLDLTDKEVALVADALNLHRAHLDHYDWEQDAWVQTQKSTELKFREAGLWGTIDGLL